MTAVPHPPFSARILGRLLIMCTRRNRVSYEFTQDLRGGATRLFKCAFIRGHHHAHREARAGIRETRIWAPKAPFSLAFHGRMTPLHRRPCRFGAPERAVSSRFEIDSGTHVCARTTELSGRLCMCAPYVRTTGSRISAFVEAALETALTEI